MPTVFCGVLIGLFCESCRARIESLAPDAVGIVLCEECMARIEANRPVEQVDHHAFLERFASSRDLSQREDESDREFRIRSAAALLAEIATERS